MSEKLNKKADEDGFYGVLESRNIKRVILGSYEFDTWYGNGAYFNTHDHSELGYVSYNKQLSTGLKNRKRMNSEIGQDQDDSSEFWLDQLYVCENCFKYTDVQQDMQKHRLSCALNTQSPSLGKLVYRDDDSRYLIKQIRGFKHSLFCQNLCLFGKLFLEDKSVFYNLDHFDFYVIYGEDSLQNDYNNLISYKPMGFFSKEVLSWDSDNNLACICIFPPYQRRHLGSLLIEFLYALANVLPGLKKSGPEFPLSPYGKISYLHFWSRKISYIINENLRKGDMFTITDLSEWTGFRKEDILLTLEFMKLLKKDDKTGKVTFLLGNFQTWYQENKIDLSQDRSMLNLDCLLI